ncbi:hypothetical protein TNCV_98221 [Trichonephila clavipes]|nr:hypothetical protein TNCV_98221 [Trichonephila clavipes]
MSFTRRPCLGCPRQTNRLEDHHIVRDSANCFIGPHSGPDSTLTRGPSEFSNRTKNPWLKNIWDRSAYYVCYP